MQPNTTSVSIVDRAYLAGLFDGEGTIGIYLLKRELRYNSKVRINMCDRPGVEMAFHLYGGSMQFVTFPSERQRRPQYQWSCYNDSAERFLWDIAPYLRVKQEQAYLFFKFRQTFRGYGRNGVPADVIDLRGRLMQRCKDLKRA